MLFIKKTLKQYGLPRSGTNYIKWFIENNYFAKVNTNIGGWKHGPYKHSPIKCFSTVKNPYSWSISIYNFVMKNFEDKKWSPFETKYYAENLDVEVFLNNEFTIRNNKEIYKFKNPISYWNFAIYNWIESKLEIIKYEDLLIDPHKSIFKLKIKKKDNLILKKKVMPGIEETIIDEKSQFNIDYYIKKEYIKKLNKNCIDAIGIQIKKELVEYLNYEII